MSKMKEKKVAFAADEPKYIFKTPRISLIVFEEDEAIQDLAERIEKEINAFLDEQA
jgi:hypothetical protein